MTEESMVGRLWILRYAQNDKKMENTPTDSRSRKNDGKNNLLGKRANTLPQKKGF